MLQNDIAGGSAPGLAEHAPAQNAQLPDYGADFELTEAELAAASFTAADASRLIEVARAMGADLDEPDPGTGEAAALKHRPVAGVAALNDPTVHSALDPAILERPIQFGYSKKGSKTYPGQWKNFDGWTVRDLLDNLTVHQVGNKDGFCITQGYLIDGDRKNNAVKWEDLLILDMDTGESLDSLRSKVQQMGVFAVIYSTHSHMKAETDVKADQLRKWINDEEVEISTENFCAYLIQEKMYAPDVLIGAEYQGTDHKTEGVVATLRHKPMTKARIVFVLKDRFIFAERGKTQRDAIAEWKAKYLGVSKKLGAYIDRSCSDPSRLFYTPRHRKDGQFFVEVVAGNLLDLDNIEGVTARDLRETNPFARAADQMTGRKGALDHHTEGLMPFFGKYGKTFDIADFLEEMDPEGDHGARTSGMGRQHRCPNDDAHSNAGDPLDRGFFCVNATDSESEQCVARCSHDSCADLDRVDFTDLVCQRAGIKHADELMKWVPELVEDGPSPDGVKPFADGAAALAAASEVPKGDGANFQAFVDRVAASKPSPAQIDAVKGEVCAATERSPKVFNDTLRAAKKAQVASRQSSDEADGEAGLIKEHNVRHAYVQAGNGLVATFHDGKMELVSVAAHKLMIAHKGYYLESDGNDPKWKPLFDVWIKSPEGRKYEGLTFAPGQGDRTDENKLNTWRGLAVEPRPGKCDRIVNHIVEVLASGDPERAKVITGWLASVLQNLGNIDKKLTWALVVRGEHGTGKSSFFECFGKIFGSHTVTLSKPKQVVGNFNSFLGEAILVILEEAFFGKDPRYVGPVKDMLTGKWTMLEKKGIDVIRVPNFAQHVIISNEMDPVRFESTERRFYAFEVSSHRALRPLGPHATDAEKATYADNLAYWDALHEEMDDDDCVAAFAHYLMTWQPPYGSFLKHPPRTPEGDEMIGRQLTAFEKWVIESAYEGGVITRAPNPDGSPNRQDVGPGGTLDVPMKAIWNHSPGDADYGREKMNIGAVGTMLKKMFPTVGIVHTANGNGRRFPPRLEVLEMLRRHPNRGYGAWLRQLEEADAVDEDKAA